MTQFVKYTVFSKGDFPSKIQLIAQPPHVGHGPSVSDGPDRDGLYLSLWYHCMIFNIDSFVVCINSVISLVDRKLFSFKPVLSMF